MISWGNGIFGRDRASSPDSACACSGEVPHAACADGATCCPQSCRAAPTPRPHPAVSESLTSARALGQLEGRLLSSVASQTFGSEEALEGFAPRDAHSSAKRAASAAGLCPGVGTARIPMGAASTIPPPARRSIEPLISHWISTLLPPLSLGLLQRQQPSLTHAAPRLALDYLKAQQVF